MPLIRKVSLIALCVNPLTFIFFLVNTFLKGGLAEFLDILYSGGGGGGGGEHYINSVIQYCSIVP